MGHKARQVPMGHKVPLDRQVLMGHKARQVPMGHKVPLDRQVLMVSRSLDLQDLKAPQALTA
jgi:hypothetical protein